MKTQMKAIIASAVVIVLALSAVAGVTYSWFSDSEEATVDVTTGKVDISMTRGDLEIYSCGTKMDNKEFLCGGTATVDESNGTISVTLKNIAPGDKVVLSVNIFSDSTISCKYRFSLTCNDYTELINGLRIDATYGNIEITAPGYSDWMDSMPQTGNISVELPTDAGNEYQNKSIVLRFTVEAYQSNASIITMGNGIYSADDLRLFAFSVNGGKTYAGEEVNLLADIDLNNVNWTPIGLNADSSKVFKGTFCGNNHTITNLKVVRDTSYEAVGLFGALNGTVKDLNIVGAEIRHISAPGSNGATSNGTAVVAGSIYNSGLIENVTVTGNENSPVIVEGNRYVGGIAGYVYGDVKSCSVSNITLKAVPDNETGKFDNGDKVGGIIGYLGEGDHSIINNRVTDVNLTAYRDVGGIIGAGHLTEFDDNKSYNVSITVDQNTNFYETKDHNAGPIVGRILAGSIDKSNSGTLSNLYIITNNA